MKLDRFLRPGWMFLAAALGYGLFLGVQLGRSYFGAKRDVDRIRHIVASEELILSLGEQLDGLSRSVLNLNLPDAQAAQVFEDQVAAIDLQAVSPTTTTAGAHVDDAQWTTAPPQIVPRSDLHLWQELLASVSYFEHAKFYIVDGHFSDDSLRQFVTHVGFKGLAKLRAGTWSGIEAKQQLVWQNRGSDDAPSWQISRWETDHVRAPREEPTFVP